MPGGVLSEEGFAGLFGKLPATGDFVERGLPGTFRARWDAWVTRHVAGRAGPWPPGGLRFRLVSGGRTASGVILPSRDAVGRRFPLTAMFVMPFAPKTDGIDRWCEDALPLLGRAAEGASDADDLWLGLDSLPRPAEAQDGPAAPLVLWTAGEAPVAADPSDPGPVLTKVLSSRESSTP